jgi:uncharacterized membrane protein
MAWLFSTFLKGLIFVVPAALTIFLSIWAFTTIDGLLNLPVTGLGFLIFVGFTLLVGALATNILFTKAFEAFEKALTRLPLVKLLYFSIKDLIGAFVGEKKRFQKPVLVDMFGADAEVKMVGYLTQEEVEMLDLPGYVAVYLPQAYNFAGSTVVVPRERIKRLSEADAARLMAFIVSGGVSTGINPTGEGRATGINRVPNP